MQYYTIIRNWSEVWAFFIPLAIILIRKKDIPEQFAPIKYYVIAGLIINFFSTTMFVFHKTLPSYLSNNNILYNIHSVARVLLFCWFLRKSSMFYSDKLFRLVLPLYFIFILVNFIFFASPLNFSTPLFIAETIVLIIFSTSYFYHAILNDDAAREDRPTFLINSGLLIFEAINFFIYLFYGPIGQNLSIELKRLIWTIHNFSLVAFCIVIAIALNKASNKKNEAG